VRGGQPGAPHSAPPAAQRAGRRGQCWAQVAPPLRRAVRRTERSDGSDHHGDGPCAPGSAPAQGRRAEHWPRGASGVEGRGLASRFLARARKIEFCGAGIPPHSPPARPPRCAAVGGYMRRRKNSSPHRALVGPNTAALSQISHMGSERKSSERARRGGVVGPRLGTSPRRP
jgi:hypothetical protein